MTATKPDGVRTKRKRKPGRPRGRLNSFRFAVELAQRPFIFELGELLPHRDDEGFDLDGELRDRRSGRRPELPPEAFLLFAALKNYDRSSDDDVEALLQDPVLWEPIRATLHRRFPQYPRLAPGGLGPSRSQFYNWKRSLRAHPLVLATLLRRFRDLSVQQALELGIADPARRGLTDLDIRDMFIGDGTVARSMFNATPGDMQWDPDLEALVQIRHDPDARYQVRKSNDDEVLISDTAGTHHALIHMTTGHPNEVLLLDVFHVPAGPGHSEVKTAVPRLMQLKELMPGAKGNMWDKAVRGRDIDELYEAGLMTHARVSQAPGGGPKIQAIETRTPVYQGSDVVGHLAIDGIGGAAHARITINGEVEHVRLEPTKRWSQQNKTTRARGFRYYQEYRIPNSPLIASRQRGGLIRLRLDTTAEDRKRNLNRAENLRPVAEGDEAWEIVGGPRSRAESLNSKVKHRWANKRIPAVGVEFQLVHLLGFGIALSTEAQISYEKRTGADRPPGPQPPAETPRAA